LVITGIFIQVVTYVEKNSSAGSLSIAVSVHATLKHYPLNGL